MNGCETAAAITALACSIAQGRDICEIQMLATIFTQLGDTLTTIATEQICREERCAKSKSQTNN